MRLGNGRSAGCTRTRWLWPVLLGLTGAVLAVGTAGATTTGLSAAASVDPHTQYLGSTGSFVTTVSNTGSISIGAVRLFVPTDWQAACASGPSGWAAARESNGCLYASAKTTADDLRPGSSATFGLALTPTFGGTDKRGALAVTVSSSSGFAIGATTATASGQGSGLGLTAYAWQVLDAVIAPSAPAIGVACPSTQTVARPGANVIVICGRNRSTESQTLVGSSSTIGGSLVSAGGTLVGGTVAPTPNSARGVVIGSWTGASATGVGTGKTLQLAVGSASNSTSPAAHFAGFSVVEHAPVANADTFAGTEDTVLSLPVTGTGSPAANDTDADGDTLTVTAVSSPTGGSVAISNGRIAFHPSANLCGSAKGGFTYTVADGFGGTATAHVTINLVCVNDPPHANADLWSGYENTVRTLPLSGPGSPAANDTDVDGDTLHVSAVSAPRGGAVAIVSGQIRFTPTAKLCGSAAAGFDYTVSDGHGGTSSAHDTIDLRCHANHPPVAVDDTFSATENTVKTLPLSGTGSPAANDTDADGDKLIVSAVSSPTGGTVGIASGQISFTPASNRCGTAAAGFTYTVSDGSGGTDTGHVTLNIACVNRPPVANNDVFSAAINTVKTLPLSGVGSPAANDTDPDGDSLHVSAVSSPTGGTVAIVSSQIEFTPTTNLCGTAAAGFSYTVDDGHGGHAGAHVTLNISCANHAPTNISLSPSSIAENQPSGTTVGTLSATDADSGQTFTYALVSGTGSTDNADFTISGSTLKSAAQFDFETKSTYSVRVRVTDSGSPAQSFEKQLTVSVTNVNEAPTNIALSSTHVNEGEPVGTSVGTFSASDPDQGQSFVYALVSGTGSTNNSSFTISGNTLKTAAVFHQLAKSSYAIRVDVTDNGTPAHSFEEQFTITVDQVDQAPTVTTNPSDSTVNAGATASFSSAAAGTPAPTVQWQVSTDAGSSWSDLTGKTSATLSFTASAGDDGNEYRAVWTNTVASATSQAATLTVRTAPVVTTDPTDATVDAGDTASFTAAADGHPVPTVQWKVSTNGGSTWSDVPGETSGTLSFTASAGEDGNEYKAVFTNAAGSATTAAATLTVDSVPSITTDPSDATVNAGDSASFSSAAGGKPAPTVQWQVSTDSGSSWSDLPAETSASLSFTASAGDDGNQYRAVWTNTLDSATSQAATLTVDTAPVVTTDPSDATVNAGDTASFSSAADGNPAPTVQWQVSTNGGSTWSDVNGETSTTLSFTAASSDDGHQYRAVFTNGAGTDTTSAATLNVNTPPSADAQSVSANEDAAKTITLTGGDDKGNALSFAIVAGPSHGALGSIGTPNCTGTPSSCSATVDYTPATNYNGSDSFTFKANNGTDDSSTATVSITVDAVNDAPSFTEGADQTVAENTGAQTVNGWATSISAGPSDESGQTVQFNVTDDSNAALFFVTPAVSGAGVLTYTPATDASGSATITLDAQDDGGTAGGGNDTSPTQTFTITVDAPPTISSTVPADTATGVALAATITVNFSKSVTASTSSFTLECPASTSEAFTLTPTAPASSYVLHPSADLPPNTTCTVTVLAAHITDAAAFHPTGDSSFSFTTVVAPPVATNDSFTATGNVGLTIPVGSGVTQNDTLSGGTLHGFGATSGTADGTVPNGTNTVTTSNGGTVTLASDGSFTYDPPAGYTGGDSFYYNLHGPGGDSVGQATVTISHMIWFVDNTAGSAGDGRLDHPFNTLGGLSAINSGAAPHPQNSDTIFVSTGSGAYTGGITLRGSQLLIGQGASAGIASISGITLAAHSNTLPSTGGTAPSFTAASGSDVTLGSGNTLRGIALGNRTGSAISGSSFGTLTVATDVGITGSGQALSLTTGTVSGAFGSVSSTSGTNGISLSGVTGTVSTTGGALSGSTGDELTISGGTANVTYAGTITKTGAGHVVNVGSATGGTIALTGAVSETDGNASGTGVNLTSNTGATITFSGGLTLSTGANTAFTATGGGTVNVNNASVVNTLTTTTATALNVSSTTIGTTGLKFQSITSSGGASGINLSSTGSTGGLTVTGLGTTANSGGTIQSATTAGVLLSSTSSVSLSYMLIKSNPEGIKGTSVSGFALANSTVSGNGSGAGQDGVDFTGGLTGTASVTSSTISSSGDNNMAVTNSSGSVTLTITGSTFDTTTYLPATLDTSNPNSDDGLEVDSNGTANTTVSVTGSTFNNNRGYHFYFDTGTTSSGTNSVTFSSNTITNSLAYVAPYPHASVYWFLQGNSSTSITTNGNNSQGAYSPAFSAKQVGSSGSSITNWKFTNNTAGSPSVTDSGSKNGAIISSRIDGQGTMNMLVTGNTMYQYGFAGIDAATNSGTATLNLTASGNSVSHPGTIASYGFVVGIGGPVGANPTVCASFGTNSITGAMGTNPNYALADIELDWYGGVFKLPSYTGSSSDASGEVETYLENRIGGSPYAYVFDDGATPNFVNTASCPTPP